MEMKIFRVPCYVTYVGSVMFGMTEVFYAEKVFCEAVMKDDSFDDAVEHLLFGEEPSYYSPVTRLQSCRWALGGQDPLMEEAFDTNREDIPLQNIQDMMLVENSFELV